MSHRAIDSGREILVHLTHNDMAVAIDQASVEEELTLGDKLEDQILMEMD